MLKSLLRPFHALLGRGEYAVTIPVMDGAFQPNQALEAATRRASAPSVDNLVLSSESILCSSNTNLLRLGLNDSAPTTLASFDTAISCLSLSPNGAIAVGLEASGLIIQGGPHNGKVFPNEPGTDLGCLTACLWDGEDALLLCNGSSVHGVTHWKHDLMSLGRSGSVIRLSLATGSITRLSSNLAFPYGIARSADGQLLVSESWLHRVVKIDSQAPTATPQQVLSGLPGYPARIIPASIGGYWLTLFAARNQLIEFVLREREYCRRMMETVEPEYWIAPAYTTGRSFKEPLQGDGVKQMGVLKPWAPPRSYGLIVLCDAEMKPLHSWHSRADGSVHAITSVVDTGSMILASARGPGQIVELPIPTQDSREWE